MPQARTPDTTTTRLLEVSIEHQPEADVDALLATWIEDQALPELLEAAPKSRLMSLELLAAAVRPVDLEVWAVSPAYMDGHPSAR